VFLSKLQALLNTPKVSEPPSSALSDDDEVLISEDELEYKEGLSESDSSGSEFQMSEDYEQVVGVDESDDEFAKALNGLDDEEAESVLISAAIKLSKETNKSTANGASSSKAPPATRSTAAALRAAAAERRLAVEQAMELSEEEFEQFDASGSEESEPLSKGKGKGKASTVKKTTVRKQSKATSLAERRAEKRAERQLIRLAANSTKKEEMELRRKLGRKLSHVRLRLHPQAEIECD